MNDYERAAVLKHGEIPKIEKELIELNNTDKNKILSDVVKSEDIARIIAKWTNIPVTKLISSEKEKLLSLEDNMRKRVMGQDEALELVESLKKELEGEDVDKIKEATEKLSEKAMALGAKVYEEANKKAAEEAANNSNDKKQDGPEVVDAEFEEKK